MSKTENKEKETKVTDEEEIKETEEVSEEVAGENAAEDTAEVSDGKEAEKDGKEAKEEIKVDPKDLEIADLKDKLLRNMAEFDNYRKRTAKERMELAPEITARNLTEFLPVMDNLERALAAECKDPDYKKGIEMIHESFTIALNNLGVETIESDGKPFDPTYHQAVQQVEDDSKEEGTIAATFQKGYKIGDKVLRFAMVAVVK